MEESPNIAFLIVGLRVLDGYLEGDSSLSVHVPIVILLFWDPSHFEDRLSHFDSHAASGVEAAQDSSR